MNKLHSLACNINAIGYSMLICLCLIVEYYGGALMALGCWIVSVHQLMLLRKPDKGLWPNNRQ